MAKTLVIPDIHQDIDSLNKIFKIEDVNSFDEIIFLGDWFDSFSEPPRVHSFEATCSALRALATNNKNHKMVFLVGNHDLAYIYHNTKGGHSSVQKKSMYNCSGVTKSKIGTFRKMFYDNSLRDRWFIENFKIAHQSQGWIFSHAGIVNNHIPYGWTVDRFITELSPEVWSNFRNLLHPHNSLLSGVGTARGGIDTVGGPIWLDYHSEFFASPDIGKQVFGHTYVPEPTASALNTEYESWNLDTNLRDYAIIRDGHLSTYLVSSSIP